MLDKIGAILKSIGFIAIYFISNVIVQTVYTYRYRYNYIKNDGDMEIYEESLNNLVGDKVLIMLVMSIILALIIYLIIYRYKWVDFLQRISLRIISKRDIFIYAVIGVAMNIMLIILIDITNYTEVFEGSEMLGDILGGKELIPMILVIGILVPIFEELIFRGLVLKEVQSKFGSTLAVIASALFFAIYHGNMFQGVYTLLLGIILGISFVITGSLLAPIIIHMFFNSTNIIISVIMSEAFYEGYKLVLLGISIALFVVLFVLQIRKYKNKDVYI